MQSLFNTIFRQSYFTKSVHKFSASSYRVADVYQILVLSQNFSGNAHI